MDYVDLRAAEGHELFASRQTPLPVVLAPYNVDLPSQFADSKVPPISLHGPNGAEALLDALGPLPLDDAARCLGALPEDVVAVVGPVEHRLRHPLPLVAVALGQPRQPTDLPVQRLALDAGPVLAQRVQRRRVRLPREQVLLAVVRGRLLEGEGEDLLEVLLEVDDQRKDAVVLQSAAEVARLLDEDLVEVGVVVLQLVEQVAREEGREGGSGVAVDAGQLLLEHLLAHVDYLVQVLQLLLDVLGVNAVDAVLEKVDLLLDQHLYLLQPRVYLRDRHVVLDVVLHLRVLACPRRLQTPQPNLSEFLRFLESLSPAEILLVRVPLAAVCAQLAVVVAEGGATDAEDGLAVQVAGAYFGRWPYLFAIHY